MTVTLIIVIMFAAALSTALLLVRLRLRLELSPARKVVFVGLGRSGPEIDFRRREIQARVFGFRIKSFSVDRPAARVRTAATEEERVKSKEPHAKPARRRSVAKVFDALPHCLGALWKYFTGLLRAAIVEQAEGEIEAGFGSPHVTGQVYGCYQAMLGVAPAMAARVRFVPVWTGRSYSGELKVSIAWPIYRLLGQTALLIWRLPKRKLMRLVIGEKKGDRHVK